MNRITQICGTLVLALIMALSSAVPALAHIQINEVMPDPVTISDTKGEWIELHNKSADEVVFTGNNWAISVNSASKVLTGSIAPNGYFVICRNSDSSSNGNVTCNLEWSGMSLTNNRTIELRQATELVDSVTYVNKDVKSGHSLQVVDEENQTTVVPDESHVYNEKAADPEAEISQDNPVIEQDYGTPGARNTIDTPSVTPENFNTHSSTDYEGINVGFNIANFKDIKSVKVELFLDDRLIVTNTGKAKLIQLIHENKGTIRLSSPFIIHNGTYVEEYWDFGSICWTASDKPTTAVVTVEGMNETLVARNSTFTEPNNWAFGEIVSRSRCVNAPLITAPINGMRIDSNSGFLLDWTDVNSPNMPVTYEINVSDKSDLDNSGTLTGGSTLDGISVSEYAVSPNRNIFPGTYYWQVRAVDTLNNISAWSAIANFVVTASQQPAPVIQPAAPTSSASSATAATAATPANSVRARTQTGTRQNVATSSTGNVQGTDDNRNTSSANSENSQETDNPSENKEDSEPKENEDNNNSGNRWYWWLIALATLAVIYYLAKDKQ